MNARARTGLWESCPMKEKPTHQYYDLMRPFESATYKLDLEMWSFLEKIKVELDKIEAIDKLMTGHPNIHTLPNGQYSILPMFPSDGDKFAKAIMEILYPDEEAEG